MIRSTIYLLLLFIFTSCSSIKWQPVDPEILHAEKCKQYPEAHAEIIYKAMYVSPIWEGNVNITYSCEYSYVEQRKIYTREGFEFADIQIPVPRQDYGFIVQGRTVHPDGSVIKLDPKSVHKKKLLNMEYYVFALPDVTPGSIVEYRYKYSSDNITFLDPFNFQELLPVREAVYFLHRPVNMRYSVAFHNKPNSFEETIEREKIFDNVFFNYKLTGRDLPPIKIESYNPHMDYLTTSVAGVLTEMDRYTNILQWKDLLKYVDFNEEIEAEPGVYEIVNLDEDSELKVESIYNWIQENIKFDGRRVFTPRVQLPETTIKNRSGNNVDLAVLLISMLRESGLRAYPVLCRYRDRGPIIKDYHSPFQFDHVVVWVKEGYDQYFLDPTVPGGRVNDLYWRVQDVEALKVISAKKHEFITLPGTRFQDNLCQGRHVFSNIESGTPSVESVFYLTGAERGYVAEMVTEEDAEGSLEAYFFGEDTGSELTEFSFRQDSLILSYTLKDLSMITRERILLNPVIVNRVGKSITASEDRYNDFWFRYPGSYVDEFVLNIPDGYALENLPEELRINDPRLGLEYNCQYSKDAESLTIMRTFNRKKYFLPQQYHMDVRETMIRLNDKDDTSIIFVRSE